VDRVAGKNEIIKIFIANVNLYCKKEEAMGAGEKENSLKGWERKGKR